MWVLLNTSGDPCRSCKEEQLETLLTISDQRNVLSFPTGPETLLLHPDIPVAKGASESDPTTKSPPENFFLLSWAWDTSLLPRYVRQLAGMSKKDTNTKSSQPNKHKIPGLGSILNSYGPVIPFPYLEAQGTLSWKVSSASYNSMSRNRW